MGVIGIMPAPIAGTPRYSATDKPTNDTSPDTRIASHPADASATCRIHAAVFALAIDASAFDVSLKPPRPRTASANAPSGAIARRISPDNAADGTPSMTAEPSIAASASSRTSWPASISARPSAASGRVSPSVP
ncbi:hypothetical protein WL34_01820 [Burkholderia cepacia]|nr:hypothetical protein WL34_01820 [Burkholderia cepacia]